MPTGKELVELAATRIDEKYENVFVPKNNSNWHGPWDCAEFATWVVYQKTGKLYGTFSNNGNPAMADAYSGQWAEDVKNGTLIKTSKAESNSTPGIVLISKPPMPKTMGHVAISDGNGGTIEAAGKAYGIARKKVEGRPWDYYAKIPQVIYESTGVVIAPKPLPYLLRLRRPNMSGDVVRDVQRALQAAGFDPGDIDSAYGPHTVAAVSAFQLANRLVSDGIVGPLTAKKLGINWPS